MDIVLGVSGSVAAYRAADLARELMRSGHKVRVCLTDSAQRFVTPALFEALTGQPCLVDVFEEPERGRMAHIDWARQASAVVVAPATANTLNRLASGIGDDMLTTIALATTAPLVIAPAMNPHMYASHATRSALTTLAERGALIVEPAEGDVACGDHGQGKLASIPSIVGAVQTVLGRSERLKGHRVLITSGPTQEMIDDVRFLSNRSSGKMGAALARAAMVMGAEVLVVTGPTHVPLPLGAEIVRVRSADEMMDACMARVMTCSLVVAAAAVADYRPAHRIAGKMRRSAENLTLELAPNPDIVAALAAANPSARVVGFAAEPDNGFDVVKDKIERKGLFAIAANDIGNPAIGFESDQNELHLHWSDGRIDTSGQQSKLGCALWLLEKIAPSTSQS